MSKQLNRSAVDQLVAAGQLITRTATITRAADTEAREFTGVGVPYDEVIEHWFGSEQFDRGSVEADGAILLYGHRDTIGTITAGRDTADGFVVDGRISDTALGRDVWTLVRDGAISKLSIGFEPLEYSVEVADNGDEVIHWTKVRAREFSLVPFPAYDSAALDPASLRHRPTPKEIQPMSDALRESLATLEATLDDHTRSLKLLEQNTGRPAVGAGSQWRSMGEFLKALAGGDTDAADYHRDYTGATTADTVDTDNFVGDYIRLVDQRRKIVNDFTRGPLPADGMSVDYVQLKDDTTAVAKQTAEGADLVSGKVQLEAKNAPVDTYGGWTELSRQAIERASVPTLNITLRALALKYAQATNNAVVAKLVSLVDDPISGVQSVTLNGTSAGFDVSAVTADAWIDAVIEAALKMEAAGFDLTRLHVTPDVFKHLAKLKDGDHRLMNIYGTGVNVAGEVDLRRLEGNLANISVRLLPPGISPTVGRAVFSDPLALEFLESPGAPAQLQDENVINLTKAYSVYGYAAVLAPFPQALVQLIN